MGSWDEEVDVIVAGSGAAGCSAAIGAHLAGAKSVLVLEKDAKMSGGTTRQCCCGGKGATCRHLALCAVIKEQK